MNEYMKSELKSLLSDSMCERQGSYIIEDLLSRFPTVSELAEATEQELIQVKGIGLGKARQLTSLLRLAKVLTTPVYDRSIVRSPGDVFELLETEFRHLQNEHFVCLFLNTKNHLIFKEVISIGSLNSAIVHPREVFRAAIKRSSASLICAHNHPSGDPEPSIEDVSLTKRLIAAGEIIGIEVLDHVIIGGNRYHSLKEHGQI